MLQEQWPDLLQKKSRFPFEATLRMAPNGQEPLSFEVDKIERKKIDDKAEVLFAAPNSYLEVSIPTF
jgi:hypothetical protein